MGNSKKNSGQYFLNIFVNGIKGNALPVEGFVKEKDTMLATLSLEQLVEFYFTLGRIMSTDSAITVTLTLEETSTSTDKNSGKKSVKNSTPSKAKQRSGQKKTTSKK